MFKNFQCQLLSLYLQSLPKIFEPFEQKQTFLVILGSLENIESSVPPRDGQKHSRGNSF